MGLPMLSQTVQQMLLIVGELEIELLHEKVDLLREQELKALAESVHRLSKQMETLLAAGKN